MKKKVFRVISIGSLGTLILSFLKSIVELGHHSSLPDGYCPPDLQVALPSGGQMAPPGSQIGNYAIGTTL